MLQGKRTRKAIAATFIVVLLTNIVAPNFAYALTSGPTAPEATSFEPIDTTDMVNLQTGDFTYNIPLLEVPGPEGGYPLSLSYHAGIQPNEDASWVGLGWTLNPGAINRSVNGYPDDWKDAVNSSHRYWTGGTTTTYNIGINAGRFNGPASPGFGLSISNDTYRGFGVGFEVNLDSKVGGPFSPIKSSLSVGTNPYGGVYMGGDISTSAGAGQVGFGFQTNFQETAGAVSAGFGVASISLGTNQKTPALSVAGVTASVRASKTPGIQTKERNLGITLPLFGFNISLGRSKVRYWTDEKTETHINGGLFVPTFNFQSGYPISDDYAYDGYSLLEDPSTRNVIEHGDPTKEQGGAFTDFDQYQVSAQGLGGVMRPYIFWGETFGQNKKDGSSNELVTYSARLQPSNYAPMFRFEGDFSNTYRQAYDAYPAGSFDYRSAAFPFSTPVWGNEYGIDGGNSKNISGSKYIKVGVSVQPSNTKGYVKSQRYATGMIEGFSITNESGVTYHYGLPAYCYNEQIFQGKIGETSTNYNLQTKGVPYAYTWYLTSITGPDYVDRDEEGQPGYGKASSSDWGYWINFEYGKWSDSYEWRNPSEGSHRDEDNEWESYSSGFKEVYYLNAIRSRTHAAIFEKSIRLDGKGISGTSFSNNSSQSLRLDKIYLLNAVDGDYVSSNSGSPYSSSEIPSCASSNCQLPDNVIDKKDIEAVGRANMEDKAIRIIDFQYNYSLCDKTINSFSIDNPSVKYGKLSLEAVSLRGVRGAEVLPPIKLEYEVSGADQKTQNGVLLSTTNFVTTNSTFEVGEMIKKDDGTYCGVIVSKEPDAGGFKYYLSNSNFIGSLVTANISTTKNPPYNKDAFDNWQSYKSDIKTSATQVNENVARQTSDISIKAVDAWSLRKIISSLGNSIRVGYESDTYNKVVLDNINSLIVKNITTASNRVDLTFEIETHGVANNLLSIQPQKSYKIYLLALLKDDIITGDEYVKITSQRDVYINSVSGGVFSGTLNLPIYDYFDFEFQELLTGNIMIDAPASYAGGGLRVKRLEVVDELSDRHFSTSYDYTNPSTLESSGVTSYSPNVAPTFDQTAAAGSHTAINEEYNINMYKAKLYSSAGMVYALAREYPAPGVHYEYVTVRNTVKNPDEGEERNVPGKTVYNFEVFRDNYIVKQELNAPQEGYVAPYRQVAKNIVFRKFTSAIGNVKSIVRYGSDGNILTEIKDHYLHDGLESLSAVEMMDEYKSRLADPFKYQGFLQERLVEVKTVANTAPGADTVKATLSGRESYPCIQTGRTVKNYVDGTSATVENIEFDFYSGNVTKTVETDSYGNKVMTDIKPAYRQGYSSLGMMYTSADNKNMLTQVAGVYTYKVNATNQPLGLISAEANTWSNSTPVLDLENNSIVQNAAAYGNVWREQSTYSWLPAGKTSDGLSSLGSFVSFNWGNPGSSNANWKKVSETTLFDVYSEPLESSDINGNLAAVRLGYGNQKVILTGSNAKFFEMAFSGAEDESINQTNLVVSKGEGTVSSSAHTGTKSLSLNATKTGFSLIVPTNNLTYNRDYVASVWVKPAFGSTHDLELYYAIDGVVKGVASSASSTKTSGSWTLLTIPISGADILANKTLTIACRNDYISPVNVDDFRFQPVSAVTQAFVYDPFTGALTHVLDNNNLYSKYEYDDAGRLTAVYKEKMGASAFKTREFTYNYGQPLLTP